MIFSQGLAGRSHPKIYTFPQSLVSGVSIFMWHFSWRTDFFGKLVYLTFHLFERAGKGPPSSFFFFCHGVGCSGRNKSSAKFQLVNYCYTYNDAYISLSKYCISNPFKFSAERSIVHQNCTPGWALLTHNLAPLKVNASVKSKFNTQKLFQLSKTFSTQTTNYLAKI